MAVSGKSRRLLSTPIQELEECARKIKLHSICNCITCIRPELNNYQHLCWTMILLFDLPSALIPLLKFSSSTTKMGPHKNSIYIIVFSWALGLGIVGINIYYLSTAFVGWFIDNNLPKVGNVFVGLLVFHLMVV